MIGARRDRHGVEPGPCQVGVKRSATGQDFGQVPAVELSTSPGIILIELNAARPSEPVRIVGSWLELSSNALRDPQPSGQLNMTGGVGHRCHRVRPERKLHRSVRTLTPASYRQIRCSRLEIITRTALKSHGA